MFQRSCWRQEGSTEAADSHHLPSPNPRSDASREELAELAQQANPEEIQLGEDEDEDEMDLEPNEVRLEQQSVPAAVFGSLKED